MPRSRRIRWGGNNGPIPLGDSVDYWPVPTEALDQFPGPKYFEPIERLRLAAIERADLAQAKADLARAEIDRATAKAKKERNDRAATYGRGRREAKRADRFREAERLRSLAELEAKRQEADRIEWERFAALRSEQEANAKAERARRDDVDRIERQAAYDRMIEEAKIYHRWATEHGIVEAVEPGRALVRFGGDDPVWMPADSRAHVGGWCWRVPT